MHDYQRSFIDFMVDAGVLRFGDFTTKSGRRTPYFVNTGLYRSGTQLARLGRAYAAAIDRGFPKGFDCLFGPAYKGIPLVVAVAMAFAEQGRDVEFCFNRKESKDHGEGGVLVGRPLRDGDRVLIVEDVTTAGTSIRETVPLLRAAADVRLAGLVVSVDRQERASETSDRTALAEVGAEFTMPTAAIVTIDEVVEHLGDRLSPDDRERIAAYRSRYGAAPAAVGDQRAG
jgi:orotate phosphoribosyltransferase